MDRGHVRRFIGIGHHVEEFDLSALVPGLGIGIDPLRFLRGQGAARTRRRRHDQLPAITHRPSPEQAFRRIVEIDELVRETLAEHLPARGHSLVIEQVDAGQPRWWLDATRGEHGRHDVDGTRQGVARARLNRAWLPEHDRAAQAAVVRREFRTGCELRRVGALDPAIVGDVDDERVRRQVLTVEMIEQIADRAVEPLDVAPVPGHVHAICLRGIVLDELRHGIVRVVRQHRRIPHEERFAGGSRAADEVIDRLHRVSANGEPLVAVPCALRHALRESTARKIPLPPFSGLQTLVAARTEQSRQRRPLLEVPGHALASRCEGLLATGWVVAHDPVLVRISPGDDRGQARGTETARDVTTREHEAFAGQSIEMRRAQVRMAHERIVAPVLIVGEDEHHVRRRIGGDGQPGAGDSPGCQAANHPRPACRS